MPGDVIIARHAVLQHEIYIDVAQIRLKNGGSVSEVYVRTYASETEIISGQKIREVQYG